MSKKSLQLKIIIVVSIPMLALIYFSYSFITSKYHQYKLSKVYLASTKVTNILTTLAHNIQLERGLGAGYLVYKNNTLLIKLNEQQKLTDKAYSQLLQFYNSHDEDIHILESFMKNNYVNLYSDIFMKYSRIKDIRIQVHKKLFTLGEELNYYTSLNASLVHTTEIFVELLNNNFYKSHSFLQLQILKENAGLQRAYIYNTLLNQTYNTKNFLNIKTLELKQNIAIKAFLLSASQESLKIYEKLLNNRVLSEVNSMKIKFYNKELTIENAKNWFYLSSLYINTLQEISENILFNYKINYYNIQKSAYIALYITITLWIISMLSYIFLLYFLQKLFKKEQILLTKLRISSYAFDSHEAIIVTDTRGRVLQVNRAFTEITNYEAKEVLGKKSSILRSVKHSKDFYRNIWKNLTQDGKWSGEVYSKRKNGELFLERLSITAIKDDDGIISNYIAQFVDISDLKKAQEYAEHQADHDFLTGLLNRKSLMRRLHEEYVKATRHNFTHAFLFIDLDYFKAVNDIHGHVIGDKVLIEVTRRIKNILREEDIFARMSGDEFAIILLNIDSNRLDAVREVKNKCTKIIKLLDEDFIFQGSKINIGASIGIKIFPNDEANIQTIIINADTAMYQAKSAGRNKYKFFDKSIELQLQQNSILEEELKQALINNEFVFYLQPKVNVEDGLICGAEALVRWLHPTKGLLYPGDFLETASKMKIIPSITKLALKSVCLFIKENNFMFKDTISININASELLNPHFEKQVMKIISAYEINPSQIELEILENDLIEDIDMAITKITSFRNLGLQISIDDFGTGYSSITYLKKLPVNNLKLDRNFTQNLHDNTNKELIKIMINMAKTFNMKTVVEGVETASQLQYIKECGADMYQGFYCSAAVDQKSFLKLLNKV